MKRETILKIKKVSFVFFTVLLVASIIHITINTIELYNNPTTSFPWYSAIFFTGIYYLIPLVILLGNFLYFLIKSKK